MANVILMVNCGLSCGSIELNSFDCANSRSRILSASWSRTDAFSVKIPSAIVSYSIVTSRLFLSIFEASSSKYCKKDARD